MLDKTVETALDALYKFGIDLEVEIAARFSAKEVNDDLRQSYRFVEIEGQIRVAFRPQGGLDHERRPG